MDPIPLKRNLPESAFLTPSSGDYPHLYLDNLKGVDIPEEGEIRFRYSRLVKTEREDRNGESISVELCLKKITDICDCKGRDAEYNEDDSAPEKDTDETLDDLMESMDEEDTNEAETEEEDY